MRALLCAPLCNCRHSLRADDEEALVEVALEHMKHHHPYASVEEERIRQTICTRSYDIDYVVKDEGAMGRRRSLLWRGTEAPYLEVEESNSP
jgi:predicted small metal-binding protein